MICSECGSEVSFDALQRVLPCTTCKDGSYDAGFHAGHDSGYTSGRNDQALQIFKSIYKLGYSDCYMKLTNDWASNWMLRFAAEDAWNAHKNDYFDEDEL